MKNEAILEPVARWFRFKYIIANLPKGKLVLADLGCGPTSPLKNRLSERLVKYIPIDPFLTGETLKNKIKLTDASVDVVVGAAFWEHIDYPREILHDAMRILKPGGKLILTTPTPAAKIILEILAFKLGLLSKREIAEHKNYFDREDLLKMLSGTKYKSVKHTYFEFGLNNLLVVLK